MWSISFAVLLAAVGDLTVHSDLDNATEVIVRMNRVLQQQNRELCAYSVQRRYTIRNRHLEPNAGMSVDMKYDAASGKSFTITGSEHLGSVSQRVLRDLIEEERAASKEPTPRSQVNPQHYDLSFEGIETRNGHRCYRIGIKPKERNRYLIAGVAWVDTTEFALVRIAGHSAKSISFWIGSPQIEQDYAKVARFWLPLHNRSMAQVKLAGETELDIESFNYQLPRDQCSRAVTPPAKQPSVLRLLPDTPAQRSPAR